MKFPKTAKYDFRRDVVKRHVLVPHLETFLGTEIEHDRWGRGIIVDLRQSALGMEATIHFTDMGSDKRLDLTLAPIKVV